jgi:prolyl-tRNA synthetase
LPWIAAPMQVVIVPILLGDKEKVLGVCRDLQQKLIAARVRVQLDTSDERPGAKFYKWELKGVPIRLEVGPRDIEKGVVTLARRDGVKKALPMEGLAESLQKEADELQTAILAKARQFAEEKVKEVSTIAEAKQQTEAGVAQVPWCGEVDCGHQLEDQVGANMLGEPQYQTFAEAACAVCGKKSTGRTYMARQY